MSRPRVVVVGAGIAGLATAALLARGGAEVTVLERHERLGGRAGQMRVEGFTFDVGPSWYFMPEVFAHFFGLFNRQIDDYIPLRRLDPAYRMFTEPPAGAAAEVLEVRADAEANWAAFEAIQPGAGAAMREYAAASSDAYRMALAYFLHTTFQRPDRVAAPEVVGRLGDLGRLLSTSLADRIESTVADPRLRQILGYHAVFLGSSPYRAPALYSLMSHLDLVDGVYYPEGGLYRVIEAIARVAAEEGVTVRLGAEVTEIEVDPPEGPVGSRVERAVGGLPHGVHERIADPLGLLAAATRVLPRGRARAVRLASGEVVAADVVVAAGDLHHTETVLLDERWRTYPESFWATRDPGISSLLVYAGVRGPLPQLAHHSLFFTRDWPGNFEAILGPTGRHAVAPDDLRIPSPASLYVSRPSASDRSVAPAGHENLMLLVPFPADPRIGAGPDGRVHLDRLADGYLAQVAAWAGIPDLLERVVVRRTFGPAQYAEEYFSWRGSALGMEHTLLQSAMFRPGIASRRVANLLYAGGGTVPGVGLPMCLISAQLVAKRLLGETSTRALPAPLRPGFLDAAGRYGALA